MTAPAAAQATQPKEITQQSAIDAAPNSPPRRIKASADTRREYVGAGGWGWYSTWIQSLPAYIDDITRDFGSDLYARMMHDPQVSSQVNVLIMAVLAEGLEVSSAVDADDAEYTDQEKQLAQEIADFCMANTERLPRPLSQWLREMLKGALTGGHKIAEQVYEVATLTPERGPQLALKDLKCKPPEVVAFVVDAYNNVLGLLYVKPQSGYLSTPVVRTDGTIENMLPRDKFAVLTNEPQNADPRGTSVLRTVYHPWWQKQQLGPEHLSFLARFGQPSIFGTVAEDAPDIVTYDVDGITELARMTAVEALYDALVQLRNAGVLAATAGTDARFLEINSDGHAFINAFELHDRQIAKGILLQTRATMEAENGSKADSQTAQDVMGLLVRTVKEAVEDMVRMDVFRPLIRYNYGDDAAARFMPRASLGEVEQQDFPNTAKAVAALQTAAYLHPSQYAGIDEMLNLPPRDMDATAPGVQPEPGTPPEQDEREEGSSDGDVAEE
jgi:hypothetical protein